jgi:predicted nucleotidyltransferase
MNGTKSIDLALLSPPDDAAVSRAIDAFAGAIRRHYGSRLRGLHLFGSRARGDHSTESDVDIAVVLDDRDWDFWREKLMLSDLSYGIVVDTGADVQGWPVRESEWSDPLRHRNPSLVRAMRRDARELKAII